MVAVAGMRAAGNVPVIVNVVALDVPVVAGTVIPTKFPSRTQVIVTVAGENPVPPVGVPVNDPLVAVSVNCDK